MSTLVIQSAAALPDWARRCQRSVRAWAEARGYGYAFFGDEALARLTPEQRTKLAGRGPIQADLARLHLIREALEQGHRRAAWLDIDVLVFAPSAFDIDTPGSCAFGREVWIDRETAGGKLRVHRNVHNAVCTFRAGCPVLPFLIHASERIIARIDPRHIAPQVIGPKLLGALHNIVGFDLIESAGALSPALCADLLGGGGEALERVRAEHGARLAALNLAASVNPPEHINAAIDALLEGALE